MEAPGQARALVARAGQNWRLSLDVVQVAQLIVTELVSNAVMHAGTPMEFSVVLRGENLHLAVADGSARQPRRDVIDTERSERGRGLQVVDAVARSWGCVPTPDGKVVWATVRARP